MRLRIHIGIQTVHLVISPKPVRNASGFKRLKDIRNQGDFAGSSLANGQFFRTSRRDHDEPFPQSPRFVSRFGFVDDGDQESQFMADFADDDESHTLPLLESPRGDSTTVEVGTRRMEW